MIFISLADNGANFYVNIASIAYVRSKPQPQAGSRVGLVSGEVLLADERVDQIMASIKMGEAPLARG